MSRGDFFRPSLRLAACSCPCLLALLALGAVPPPGMPEKAGRTPESVTRTGERSPAAGPLRTSSEQPLYFTDPSGRAVYLTGSHTWNSLQEIGPDTGVEPFDFEAYLDFLERHGHNFIRLWRWEAIVWNDPLAKARHVSYPHPWLRSGTAQAVDGQPRFDLEKFDPAYFSRLRRRVESARQRGIYVSVMLFEGWVLRFPENGWQGHPFHPLNNVNGLDDELEAGGRGFDLYSPRSRRTRALQQAYVRKVIDSVNDLDNVLYEIANESDPSARAWQHEMVAFVRAYQAGLPQQHPVGLTSSGGEGEDDTEVLFGSSADWISPNAQKHDYREAPPAPRPAKIVLLDTDHLWGLGGSPEWAWKSFTRGLNPILMDAYAGKVIDPAASAVPWTDTRRALGLTRQLSLELDLGKTRPRPDLASTGYCLANPGIHYVIYVPADADRRVTVDLSGATGRLDARWLNPSTGALLASETLEGGAPRTFEAPSGACVLHVRALRSVR